MKVLLVGSGGREHALAWKIKQSPRLTKLYCAPGNAGTAQVGENVDLGGMTNEGVVEFAKQKAIDLVVVQTDNFLAAGLVDTLQAAGVRAFGPTKAAAQVEWSKSFAKELMRTLRIPTAHSVAFTTSEDATSYIADHPLPIVVKADGLAQGKGVVVAQTRAEALAALDLFIKSGSVVIEEFLKGVEVSIHAFCDGKVAKLFPIARDHKRIGEGNTGPNTGGMGTIAPVHQPPEFLKEVQERVVDPVVRALPEFKGVLFPGLMLTDSGIKVLEFNARFGDPETESYMRLLETDILDIFDACIDGTLENLEIRWSEKAVTTVMLASKGYPGVFAKGFPIKGIKDAEADPVVKVFHAGTRAEIGTAVTSGGRVLGVSATGAALQEARRAAYAAVKKITFTGKYFRRDIGRIERQEFEGLVSAALDAMPEKFVSKLRNVAVLVEEGKPEGELLGLYQGVPSTARGDAYGIGMTLPDTITIYMLPVILQAEESNLPVAEVVRETVWHEVAHYFGMGEEDVHGREEAGTNRYE